MFKRLITLIVPERLTTATKILTVIVAIIAHEIAVYQHTHTRPSYAGTMMLSASTSLGRFYHFLKKIVFSMKNKAKDIRSRA